MAHGFFYFVLLVCSGLILNLGTKIVTVVVVVVVMVMVVVMVRVR